VRDLPGESGRVPHKRAIQPGSVDKNIQRPALLEAEWANVAPDPLLLSGRFRCGIMCPSDVSARTRLRIMRGPGPPTGAPVRGHAGIATRGSVTRR